MMDMMDPEQMQQPHYGGEFQQHPQQYHMQAFNGTGADPGLEALIDQVKNLQRGDQRAKDQWNIYCDISGGGKRDPARHTAEFLNVFLDTIRSGGQFAAPAQAAAASAGLTIGSTEETAMLVNAVKVLQKKSANFRGAWTQFCKEFGGGTNDPSKHDSNYMVKFFDFVTQHAAGIAAQNGNDVGGPPAKRMRTDMVGGCGGCGSCGGCVGCGGCGGCCGCGGCGTCWGGPGACGMQGCPNQTSHGYPRQGTSVVGGGNGPPAPGTKDYLVAQVKSFQREGQQQKELWATYADLYLGGVRDPNRHEYATLLEFISNHNLPPPPANWGIGSALQGPPDPLKDQLVLRIKSFQKVGPEQREVWQQFAGKYCDPARHEVARLQEFIAIYNVPSQFGSQ